MGAEDADGAALRLAAAFEPYLEAIIASEDIGEPFFDKEVTGPKSLALFLAKKAVEVLAATKTATGG